MCEYMEQDLKVSVSKYMRYLLRYDPENLKMDRRARTGIAKKQICIGIDTCSR